MRKSRVIPNTIKLGVGKSSGDLLKIRQQFFPKQTVCRQLCTGDQGQTHKENPWHLSEGNPVPIHGKKKKNKTERIWINENIFTELRWSSSSLYTREGSRRESTSWAAACLNSAQSLPSLKSSWEYLLLRTAEKNAAIGEVFSSMLCLEDAAGKVSTSLSTMDAPPEPPPGRDALVAPELHL